MGQRRKCFQGEFYIHISRLLDIWIINKPFPWMNTNLSLGRFQPGERLLPANLSNSALVLTAGTTSAGAIDELIGFFSKIDR
jgi:hypothetical protein